MVHSYLKIRKKYFDEKFLQFLRTMYDELVDFERLQNMYFCFLLELFFHSLEPSSILVWPQAQIIRIGKVNIKLRFCLLQHTNVSICNTKVNVA